MNKTITHRDTVRQLEDHIVSDMAGEKVMLSMKNGKYYNLGDIGGVIWDYLKEPMVIQDLIRQLVREYDVEEQACSDQVLQFIDHLAREELIKVEST